MPAYEPTTRGKHGRDTPQETFGPVVKVDKHADGKIYVITLNRPHRMNSIGDSLGKALYDAYAEFRDDPNARVSILTGAGNRAFCAGADLIQTSETRQAEAEEGVAPPRPAGAAQELGAARRGHGAVEADQRRHQRLRHRRRIHVRDANRHPHHGRVGARRHRRGAMEHAGRRLDDPGPAPDRSQLGP